MKIKVNTIGDILAGHDSAEVLNLLNGEVVREISRDGENVVIESGPDKVSILASTPVFYQALNFDRGNLLFGFYGNTLKLATELDIVRFDNGEEFSLSHDSAVL